LGDEGVFEGVAGGDAVVGVHGEEFLEEGFGEGGGVDDADG